MTPLELLMEQAVDAFEALLALLCLDATDVHPQLIPANPSLDLIVTASPRDRATLRGQGADNALQTLAALIGTQSGLATVSIQIE
jgi:hypothetical protein